MDEIITDLLKKDPKTSQAYWDKGIGSAAPGDLLVVGQADHLVEEIHLGVFWKLS